MSVENWWIWMIMAVVLAIGEILTAGFFILWFAIGAAAAGVAAMLGLNLPLQLVVFIVVSIILFAASRRFAERFTKPQPEGIGADRFFGRSAVVLEEIDNHKGTGKIRLNREEWRASSINDDVITEGKVVNIESVDGTRLIVKLKEEE